MVGLESSMDQAEAAKKTKQPKVDAAEKARQKKFADQLRKGSAPQPKAHKWRYNLMSKLIKMRLRNAGICLFKACAGNSKGNDVYERK